MKLEDLKQIAAQMAYPMGPDAMEKLRDCMRELGLDPDNLYQELEMTSRYVDTHRDTSGTDAAVHLHSHTFYEVLCCRNTCGAEYLVGTERYRLQKGDVILIPPCISHRPLLPETMEEPYVRDVLWISTELVELVRQMNPRQEIVRQNHGSLLRTAGTKWEYIGQMIRTGVRESETRTPGWEQAVIGNTISVMTHLKRAFQDAETVAPRAEKPELLDRAMAYIEKNLSRKITLEEAARKLYVSGSTISQTFRRKMGVSFYRCVTQRRLIAAKALILEGKLLEEVGTQVGFSDYSSFYRAFKQEYGISPRQFRKLQEPGEPA